MKEVPFFATIPHSGCQIPKEAYWLQKQPRLILLCDVDLFVDELYENFLKQLKIPFIVFPWHRYAVDANRLPGDKTSLTVQGSRKKSLREVSTEIHWKQTRKGDLLMKDTIPISLHKTLIKKYFDPFQEKIKKQFESYRKRGFSSVYHIDLHSMPGKGSSIHRDSGKKRSDVVISDREGRSAGKSFVKIVREAFESEGFNVSLNWPYKGGRITQTYGNPVKGQHTVQIELNRSLYMNETNFKKTKDFIPLQRKLNRVLHFIKLHL